MASWWRAFPRAARRYPWATNVLLYAGLFSAGDALQQRLRGGPADWRQTRRVATLALTFHGNFNYMWLRLLERALPGRAPRTVLAKVLCDQTVGGPIALSAFYVGMSILQEQDDIFLDLKQKFWNTYKVSKPICKIGIVGCGSASESLFPGVSPGEKNFMSQTCFQEG
ncbi:mpv17-like protein isoform X2 [Arvicanthis niloticus]|uniref:mpv17-like protein isoform X2 n=1 Tax=Arvicanthis niloticus TaxID=61156 RepID=UPI00402B9ED7